MWLMATIWSTTVLEFYGIRSGSIYFYLMPTKALCLIFTRLSEFTLYFLEPQIQMSQWLDVCPVSHPYLKSYLAIRASLCQRQHRHSALQIQVTLREACGGPWPERGPPPCVELPDLGIHTWQCQLETWHPHAMHWGRGHLWPLGNWEHSRHSVKLCAFLVLEPSAINTSF